LGFHRLAEDSRKSFVGFEAEISRAILPFQSRLPTACIARGRFHAFHVAVHLGKVLSQRELEETEIALVNWENYIVVQPLTSIPSDFAHSLETSGCNHSFLFP
jgi:hypothetical protein